MILELDNPIRPYPWGSRTILPELLGQPSPAAEPQAEMWMGAHPSGSSRLPDGSELVDRIAADPLGELGPEVAAEFGPRLPFLAKLLAVESTLSLQVHPNADQAARGFAAEEAAGAPVDSPSRNYRDPHHKPEMLCALGPFTALVGFRDVGRTVEFVESLAAPRLAPLVEALTAPDGLRAVVASALTRPDREVIDAVSAACARPGPFAAEREAIARIAHVRPGDPGVVVALLLNVVQLAPGDALFIGAGVPHTYQRGLGLETLANSDNVLRGGLTGKHVDVPELLAVLDFAPAPPPVVAPQPVGSELVYETPAREFRLSRLSAGAVVGGDGPEIVVCVAGEVAVSRGPARAVIAQGRSLYLPARGGSGRVDGDGVAYRVTAG